MRTVNMLGNFVRNVSPPGNTPLRLAGRGTEGGEEEEEEEEEFREPAFYVKSRFPASPAKPPIFSRL
jgi:hypothetical protein